MKASHILMAAVVTLMVSGVARADFSLAGTEHMDVTSTHDTGLLLDSSTATLKERF